MPPTLGKKPVVQPAPEPVPEPLQTTAIVIIHPGSRFLRVGRASDAYPQSIYHCIARRHRVIARQTRYEDPWMLRPETQFPFLETQRMQGLSLAQEALQYRPNDRGTYRKKTSFQQLANVNNGIKVESTTFPSGLIWTQTTEEAVFGEKALYVHPEDSYNLHWPIKHGRFNLHAEVGGTLTAVSQDLEQIWGHAIESLLEIPLKDLKHYKAVLLVPDIFKRIQVREMMNILLDRLNFGAAFVVQESMCAALGAGVNSACVVDMGDQKTSVCCVEDGLSQKNTRVVMDFGGSDLSRTFHWLLKGIGFAYKQCDLNNTMDALFIQQLKETYCHLNQDICGVQENSIQLRQPGFPLRHFSLQLGDERVFAPLAAFLPDLLGIKGSHLIHIPESYCSDPADPKDEDYVKQTMSKHEQAARLIAKRRKEAAEVSHNPDGIDEPPLDDDDTMDTLDNGVETKIKEEQSEFLKHGGIMGVDQAILMSISNCENDEMKRRMYSCIVVVGGGLLFSGADSWIKYLIWTQMPAHFRSQLETMDVFTEPKEMDPRYICWKGGSVMCCLDTAQELWIKQREWRKDGVKLIRERAPFLWAD